MRMKNTMLESLNFWQYESFSFSWANFDKKHIYIFDSWILIVLTVLPKKCKTPHMYSNEPTLEKLSIIYTVYSVFVSLKGCNLILWKNLLLVFWIRVCKVPVPFLQ